jgi:hypothetical protein
MIQIEYVKGFVGKVLKNLDFFEPFDEKFIVNNKVKTCKASPLKVDN